MCMDNQIRHCIVLLSALLVVPVCSSAADEPLVTLGGEIGEANKASLARFPFAPYDSVQWIRADLTGEKASECDDAGWGNIRFRPFKNFSGDISGRFIEIMSMNARGNYLVHPAFRQVLAEAQVQQRPGGYFAASGLIDWQKPIDNKDIYTSVMMPALWGNARLLCGLVEASRAFPDDVAHLSVARKLGDFYVGLIPRFADPARLKEYTGGDTYAAGYLTCYFPAMEGLAKLYKLTGERKYLETATTMAAFYKQFDRLPIDHAHGMLCNQVSLVLLYEATQDKSYLERVEKRWEDLVTGGYVNPAGGIMEKCHVKFGRDEGCALADWLRLNLALGRVTGKARYWAMAERTLHNHFLQNQTRSGGFGHRGMICDGEGVLGFKGAIEEAFWCCTFHGQLGFINLRENLLSHSATLLSVPLALDFVVTNNVGTIVSEIQPATSVGEILRQRICLSGMPARVVQVRKPQWAERIKAVDREGKDLPLTSKDEFLSTKQAVAEAIFVYSGDVYVESRRCERLTSGPANAKACVFGYGPKLLVSVGKKAIMPIWPASLEDLGKQGIIPFSSAMRSNDCCFVFLAGEKPLPKVP
jgi:hypothetical protein